MAKQEIIEVKPIEVKTAFITIEGDGDLVLNKMNDVVTRQLVDARKDKAKNLEKPNEWEEIITSMWWSKGKPTEYSQEGLMNAIKEGNRPCITGFGLKKSFNNSIVRNEIAQYATKFDTSVNVVNDLVPIEFAEHFIDEKLMSPKKGAPVLVKLNRFTGWKATFQIRYTDNVYSLEQIVNIINLAGFGLGIGSGRSSGYGRYHITDVK